MSQVDRVEMHFSGSDEAPELDGYRPISPLVIVACLAVPVSLLALVNPLLWIVPVVAVILSACALRQVSAPQSRYSGRLAAVTALCLALLIGSYAPARALSFERTLYRRAEKQVEAWVSLVQQGRYLEAHQLAQTMYDRFQGPGRLSDHYLPTPPTTSGHASSQDPTAADESELPQPSAADQLTAFLQDPVVKKFVEYGEQASIALVEDVKISPRHGNLEVKQRFRVSGMHDGQPESIEFFVTSTRWEDLRQANWQVANFSEAPE